MNLQRFPSRQAREIVVKAKENHWQFKVLGNFGMPDFPTVNNEWLYIPVTVDDPIIPEKALTRVRVIESMGFKTQGLIIAHEAPRLITAPAKPVEISEPVKSPDLAGIVLAIMRFLGSMFLAGLLLDPALIVVLESGEWIEVMTWLE